MTDISKVTISIPEALLVPGRRYVFTINADREAPEPAKPDDLLPPDSPPTESDEP